MTRTSMEELAGLDVDSFTGIVLSAVAVAYADGMVDSKENRVMTDAILEITRGHFSQLDIQKIIDSALGEVVQTGVEASLAQAAQRIPDEPTRAVALIFASAVAWAARGIDAREEARLEELAHALGIGEDRYKELVAAGKELARAGG